MRVNNWSEVPATLGRETAGRTLVPFDAPKESAPTRALVPLTSGNQLENETADTATDQRPPGQPDVRRMTPRQFVELGLDLYASGVIQWDEYALMAFHSELHPDYPHTIGALTGEPANPDGPRDFIRHWEERLAYEERYNTENPETIAGVRHVVGILRGIDKPTNVIA